MSATATPATVAAAIAARRARPAVPAAPAVKPAPRPARVVRRGSPVTLTLRPRTLADWKRWTHQLGVAGLHMDSTGSALVAHITYGGERVRLVAEGVPALLNAHHARRSAGVREVASHA